MYHKLVAQVNNVDTSRFFLKKQMKQTKNFLIPVNLFKKKTDSSAKISEIERKIPNISGLVTTSALTTVELMF